MRSHFWGNETLFGTWSISYNCLREIPQNETHCGCYFITVGHFDRNKISVQVIKFYVQYWAKGWRQTHEINRNRFCYGMFYR